MLQSSIVISKEELFWQHNSLSLENQNVWKIKTTEKAYLWFEKQFDFTPKINLDRIQTKLTLKRTKDQDPPEISKKTEI